MNIFVDIRPTQNAHKNSGIGRYALNLIKLLPIYDDRNSYFYGYFEKAPIPDLPETVRKKVTFIPLKKRKPKLFDGPEWKRILKQHKINLLHILDIETPYPLPGEVKTICTVHDLIPKIHPEFNYYKMNPVRKIKNRMKYEIYLSNLTHLNAIIAVSRHTKNDLTTICNLDPEKIHVIYEGVDFSLFSKRDTGENEDKILEKYGIKKPYFLHVGGLDRRKNLANVLKAFKKASCYNYQLVIAGKSEKDMPAILSKIHELDLTPYVHLPGFIKDEDLPHIYRNSEVFLYVSLYEGFGLPVLEAMASGTVVITSNTSSIPEIAGHVAILVDPEDINEISKAISQCVEGKTNRNELIEKGLEWAKTFSWDKTVYETISLYAKITAEP